MEEITMVIPSNARLIWDWFKEKTNIPDFGIAALMGNFQAESGLESVRKQGDFTRDRAPSKAYAAKADAGNLNDFCKGEIGWGLAQWTFGSRCADLAKLAKSRGKSVGDLETQLEFCWTELTNDFSNVLYTLRTAASVRIASDKVLHVYENPKDQGERVQKERAEYAQAFYDAFHEEKAKQDKTADILARLDKITEELEAIKADIKNR
ncbi:MAG: phage tail tip lysozyme [Oscillospiraceae bacterium]|nr:phage tail tip lysozyme [Oscillospiraceae bacterium]